MDDIAAYITLDNPKAAENTVRRIGEVVAGLSFFPRIGRAGRNDDTRELLIGETPYIACVIASKSCLSTTARGSGRIRSKHYVCSTAAPTAQHFV